MAPVHAKALSLTSHCSSQPQLPPAGAIDNVPGVRTIAIRGVWRRGRVAAGAADDAAAGHRAAGRTWSAGPRCTAGNLQIRKLRNLISVELCDAIMLLWCFRDVGVQ